MTYWLHRISYKWEISKPLFDRGYLTVGWGYMLWASDDVVRKVTCNADRRTINEAMNACHKKYREQGQKGWDAMSGYATRSLEIFAQFRPDDVIVVPLYGGYFSIVRVKSSPKPVTALPESALEGLPVEIKNNEGEKGLYYTDDRRKGEESDIGFYVEVEEIRRDIQRSYANSALQSRMKIRQTNTNISDLADEVNAVSERNAPVDIHDVITDKTSKIILDAIREHVKPEDVEKLVMWYMRKAGASKVYKPQKPEGKTEEYNYADADVAAEFSSLGVNIYIQVKKHDGETGSWAVEQIKKYRELQAENFADGDTNILWVLSTAGEFSVEAESLARENSVRLINGIEFAGMLADAGISDINSFR